MIEGVKRKTLKAYDGTRICYQDVGEGPPIVFANGLGGSFEAWSYLVSHFTKKYRLISWDYRGLFGSGTPDLGRVSIPDHVDDLVRIMDAEHIDKALFFGWSMGTQVILEHAVRRPDRVEGLVMICGAAGRPFDTALYTSTSRYTMPAMFVAMRRVHKQFGAVMNALMKIPNAIDLVSATKIFWRGGSEIIKTMVDEYIKLNFETYAQIMLELGRHDARPFLKDIKAPVFLAAATRDFFTPVSVAMETRDRLRDCEFHVLEGATHYAPLEFPEKLNEMLDDFIARKIRWPQKHAPGKKTPAKKKTRR
jgi:pimeloyl-ACP methyl ester carboxylesterase